MYRAPVDLLFQGGGTFEDAKSTCCTRNLWLLVNLQSKTEFASSHSDLWSKDTVSEAVMSSFVLWQVYDDTIEGKRISNFYEIDSAPPPVVLVIDPFNGRKMGMWSGVIEAQRFVEDLSWFLEAGPRDHHIDSRPETEEEDQTCYASNGTDDDIVDPSLGTGGQEPKVDCDESLVCSLCLWFPDGRTKQRRFLKTEPFQLLWSFCESLLEELEIEYNAFKLVHEIHGDSKTLHPRFSATFEESGLAGSMISVLLK